MPRDAGPRALSAAAEKRRTPPETCAQPGCDGNARAADAHYDQPHQIGTAPGDTCGRCDEPDEDAPRGYRPRPCAGVMVDDCGVAVCDECGAHAAEMPADVRSVMMNKGMM